MRHTKSIFQSLYKKYSTASAVEGFHKAFTPKQAIEYANKNGAKIVSLRYTDTFGRWQHTTIPISQLTDDKFSQGQYFDGSSIRGWQSVENSDMIIMPDPTTACFDPFNNNKTVTFICDVKDAETKASYHKDPRYIAKKSAEYLQSTKIANDCRVGAEAEFFLFDELRFHQQGNSGFYKFDSVEFGSNSGADEMPNLAYKIRNKEGYVPLRPMDHGQDIRDEMMMKMEEIGLVVETGHHEVASAQHEIDIKFAEMVKTADNMMWYKYIVKNVARQNNKVATFMPKPTHEDNGSGMHTHVSLHDTNGTNLFTGTSHAGLSEMALYFIGGVIAHADALLAICCPTTNSYRRLVPGFEAPVFQAYSARNRSAFIRIPTSHAKARRFEFRTPDPSANPYLTFSSVLMAGIDGIKNKIHPGEPTELNLYDLPEGSTQFKRVPHSLEGALEALHKDNAFLTVGGVFTKDFIQEYIDYKYDNEITPNRRIPTPKEFELYHDC